MAKLIYELIGVRGRRMKLYDTKCVITTDKTVGSFISGNITDGEKTIFLKDVVGVQLKKSGLLIGYLQFETPSMQMNNQKDNMFSENTFTYENGKNDITNELMDEVYRYVVDRIEELKYGIAPTSAVPAIAPKTAVSVQPKAEKVATQDNLPAEPFVMPEVLEFNKSNAFYSVGQKHTPASVNALPVLPWICDYCGTQNGPESRHCKDCGLKHSQIKEIKPEEKPEEKPVTPNTWRCSYCGTDNKNNYMQCKKCGQYKR